MKITPLDIQQKQFQAVFRGLNKAEVMAFLDMVRIEMEGLLRDNAQTKEDLRRMENEVGELKEREKAVKDTLLMVQRMVEDLKKGAMKEAEIVLADARTQGEQIVANAHDRMLEILEEINELKSQRSQLIAGLRSTIQTHGKILDITETESAMRDSVDEKLTYIKRSS